MTDASGRDDVEWIAACPFCGSQTDPDQTYTSDLHGMAVLCYSCGAHGPVKKEQSFEEARWAWNNLAALQPALAAERQAGRWEEQDAVLHALGTGRLYAYASGLKIAHDFPARAAALPATGEGGSNQGGGGPDTSRPAEPVLTSEERGNMTRPLPSNPEAADYTERPVLYNPSGRDCTLPASGPAERGPSAVDVIAEEERYLTEAVVNAYDEDGPGVMRGDIEGSFHRIRAALRHPAQSDADGLEPPGCPIPGACSCPGGEAELAKRLDEAQKRASTAEAQVKRLDAELEIVHEHCRQRGQLIIDLTAREKRLADALKPLAFLASAIGREPCREVEGGRAAGEEAADG